MSGNFRTVPRDEVGKTQKVGLLVEYCVEPVILGSPSSAVFYLLWEYIGEGDSYKNPSRTGSGNYVLPLAEGVVGYGKQVHLLAEFGPADTARDFDEIYCDIKRTYGFLEDQFRDDVYITNLKWVYGYTTSTPQQAIAPPI